jgi:predicted RNA-binding Zn-ribbon protein involved in translation (DUF1610 family)
LPGHLFFIIIAEERKTLMFFIIGGIQPKTVTLDKQAKSCPACGRIEVQAKRVDHYLSVFFIPLFLVKKGIPFLVCENCNTRFDERGLRIDAKEEWKERKCSHCGRPVAPDFFYCPYCGRSV